MNKEAFAIWLTGLPSSGKSTVCRELKWRLQAAGINAGILESDELRRILTPEPTYSDEERDRFYDQLADLGRILTQQGINVLIDATAHKRRYRDRARNIIPRFIEVYIECPLETCMKRDPKGIYRLALSRGSTTVPGVNVPFEIPLHPDVTLDCRHNPSQSAETVVSLLRSRLYI